MCVVCVPMCLYAYTIRYHFKTSNEKKKLVFKLVSP